MSLDAASGFFFAFVEKVTEKIDKISVFGGFEGVLKDLVKIR